MPAETFDTARKLAYVARTSEYDKQRAREVVAMSMDSVGCTYAEIYEVWEMIGLADAPQKVTSSEAKDGE